MNGIELDEFRTDPVEIKEIDPGKEIHEKIIEIILIKEIMTNDILTGRK